MTESKEGCVRFWRRLAAGCRAAAGGRAVAAGRAAVAALAIVVLVVIALPPSPAFADDTAIGRAADGVYPVASTDVEMVAENVTITLAPVGEAKLPLRSDVKCEFTFRNASPNPIEVEMAFPGEVAPDPETGDAGGGPGNLGGSTAVQDFAAAVDGQSLPVRLEPTSTAAPEAITDEAAAAFSNWYTFTVSFAAGETRTVTNIYWVMNTHDSIGTAWAAYVLETGRYWKGPIGRATVTLNLGEVGLECLENLFPNTWRVSPDGKSLVWQRENFEPSFDLSVRYSIRAFEGRDDGGESQAIKAEREKWLDAGKAAANASGAPGPTTDDLLAGYAAAVDRGDTITAAIIRSFLPAGTLPYEPPTIPAVTIAPPAGADPEACPILEVAFADPDADIVSLRVRVTHEDGGQTVEDYDLVEVDRWVYQNEYSGTYGAFLGGASNYRAEVTVTDSFGQSATKAVDWSAAAAGAAGGAATPGGDTAGPGPDSASPGGAASRPDGGKIMGINQTLFWVFAGSLGVLALAVGLLISARLRRRQR